MTVTPLDSPLVPFIIGESKTWRQSLSNGLFFMTSSHLTFPYLVMKKIGGQEINSQRLGSKMRKKTWLGTWSSLCDELPGGPFFPFFSLPGSHHYEEEDLPMAKEMEKIPWEGEFTLRSDPWAGLIASCGSFYPMVHGSFLSLSYRWPLAYLMHLSFYLTYLGLCIYHFSFFFFGFMSLFYS